MAKLSRWSSPPPTTIPARMPRPSWPCLRNINISPAPDVPVDAVGVLVTVAIELWLFWHVERTTVPSAVALKCDEMQLDHRKVVELASDMLADTDSVSAIKFEPMLYPQEAIELSDSGMRTPPKREQHVATAASLLPQHPSKRRHYFQTGMIVHWSAPGGALGMDVVAVALVMVVLY
ncbi:hypothetical protein B0H12DRAFT_1153747 [Mycena haematopus]|nr:hypothetical protein B0H12DRAFT_1153747 [Mycena haematopus]